MILEQIVSKHELGPGLTELRLRTSSNSWETVVDYFQWKDEEEGYYDLFRIAIANTYIYTAITYDDQTFVSVSL